jgi:hypothetical protein
MNKPFLIAWLLTFIVWMMGDFVVHGVLLHGDYATLPNLYRSDTDSQQYMHFMLLAHVMLAGAMVYIYRFGMQAKAWLGQGLRFGLALAGLNIVPNYLIYYAVQPLPGLMVAKQIGLEVVLMLLLGLLVAFLYRGQTASSN